MPKRPESPQLPIPAERVKRLLLTWPSRQFRPDIQLPANPPETEDWWWTYELEYGLDHQHPGRLKERHQLLIRTLFVIARVGRDVQAITTALEKIKRDVHEEAIEGFEIDTRRMLAKEAVQIRKLLTDGLSRLLILYRRLHADTLPDRGSRLRNAGVPARLSPTRKRMALYANTLRSVQRDPALAHYSNTAMTSRRRRRRAGNPEVGFIKRAKVVLQQYKVPQVLRIDLLRAIGLLPLRSSP